MRATIGVDIGATKIACGVLKEEQFLSKTTIPTPQDGWRSVLDSIVNTIRILQKSHPGVTEVGVGVPGMHDRARTEVLFAANILGFTNVPIVDYLGERLACPVALENDANAAGLAEAILGAARYASSTMFITISTGIGGCIIADGQLWRGFHGIAGEIGHVTRVPDGPMAPSGVAGALEAVASGTAIERDATFVFRKPTSTAEVFRLAQDGDRKAEQIVHAAMRYLGMAIADVQKLLDPEVFVIGGGVASVGEYFYGNVQNYAREFARGFSDVTIVPAHFGVDAGVIGAAIAARQMTAKRHSESLV
ncbi:MAG: glucokinase [Acidobacteriaceae bacterium]|jgi:glucokinase|nr:glucokinase [Acidobacteriaceae bacterium]MDX6458285.1 glucokinase [Acidobacteriaceae bacterium]MEA2261568.1 glucokinase [Acidobacteriaceae bacterium]MEA2539286.1 glucokinase [Acidobacteriaceae bacterium]